MQDVSIYWFVSTFLTDMDNNMIFISTTSMSKLRGILSY